MNSDKITSTKGEEKNKVSSDDDVEDDSDTDDEFEDWYTEEGTDACTDLQTSEKDVVNEMENRLSANFFDHAGSGLAVKRLVKDMKAMGSESIKFGIAAKPIGDNLFVWDVKFLDIPKESKLGRDLFKYSKAYKREAAIQLNMQFPQDYPFNPPFIRIVRPRFQFMTGHVTIGGSICMQLLTKSGWQPSNDIESILIQVRAQLLSDPKAALDTAIPDVEYSEFEAKMAFDRMVKKYGW